MKLSLKKITPIMILFFFATNVQSQVLISLIFGDKLNSDAIEFGLEGGLINSNISNIENADRKNGFNLGFYFDFKIQRKLFIHTGVIVKSPLGTKDLERYTTGDTSLDISLANSEVTRKLRYFHVPVLLKYKFTPQFFIEGGTQLGLLHKAFDEFTATSETGGDIRYTTSIKDETAKFDIGIAAGVGFKLLKNSNLKLGVRYYYGFIDISKNNKDVTQTNNGLYVYAGIPIGVKKAERRREAEASKNQENK